MPVKPHLDTELSQAIAIKMLPAFCPLPQMLLFCCCLCFSSDCRGFVKKRRGCLIHRGNGQYQYAANKESAASFLMPSMSSCSAPAHDDACCRRCGKGMQMAFACVGQGCTLCCCCGSVMHSAGAPDHSWSSVCRWQTGMVLPTGCKWLNP